MKIISFISIFTLCSASTLHSQDTLEESYFQVGSKWMYIDWYSLNQPEIPYVQFEIKHDTFINNTQYLATYVSERQGPFIVVDHPPFYLRVEEDSLNWTLYSYFEGQEKVQYHYNGTEDYWYYGLDTLSHINSFPDTLEFSRPEEITNEFKIKFEFGSYASFKFRDKNQEFCMKDIEYSFVPHTAHGGNFIFSKNISSYEGFPLIQPRYLNEWYAFSEYKDDFPAAELYYLRNPNISSDCFYFYEMYNEDLDIRDFLVNSTQKLPKVYQPLIAQQNANSIQIQNQELEIQSLKVYQINGQLIQTISGIPSFASETLSFPSSGMYILHAQFENGMVWREKVLNNK